jgi:elongation factor Ts
MDTIKELRELTGLSFAQIKKALDAVGGDRDKALLALKDMSEAQAAKKSDREVSAGMIGAYVHSSGIMGAIVVAKCETDFVAKNPEFKTMTNELAMHACAMAPENVEEMLAQGFVKNLERISNSQTFLDTLYSERI